MIEVKDLVKRYGDAIAVDHLTFTVERGQVYGFLGPNGAGKSTTMNMITGYLAANEGSIIINGFDILEEPEKAKSCIGYLPEQPPLYLDMTTRECLNFAADLKGLAKEEKSKSIEEIMERLNLKDVENRLIKNLSKGYKQRVGLGQALMGNPEILILDEPTVGLDPKQIMDIRNLIGELSKDHTVILSSHILSEISAICDHILIMSHGKLVACDSTKNLSKSMEGKITYDVRIKDEQKNVPKVIKDTFATQVEVVGDYEDEFWKGSITVNGKNDIRETLFYTLAENKMPIYELTSSSVSLEDIFLELTENEE